MAQRELKPEDYALIQEMVRSFQAARSKPQSFSDFQAGFTALLRMFEVKRRAQPYDPYGQESR